MRTAITRSQFLVLSLLSLLLLAACGADPDAAASAPRDRRVLQVALYPFLPNRDALLLQIQEEFEASHPDINIQYLDLSANYYDPQKADAITNTAADVLEIDSAFLFDLVKAKRIQPLPSTLQMPAGTYMPVAEDAVSVEGEIFGVPHWLCTNYLFTRHDDPLAKARTFTDLREQLGGSRKADRGLLVDLKGKTTLGEIYLDALIDRDRDLATAARHLTPATFDREVGSILKETRSFCDAQLCRNESYHDAVGFYPRQFARRRGRAMAGYSERLYYVHDEKLHACREEDQCLGLEDIAVTPLPLSEKGSQPFAWVDSLAISSTCTGQCLLDATTFIQYVAKADTVRAALIPRWGESPRYLLPALAALYSDEKLLEAAPLYQSLAPAVRDAIAVRGQSLIPSLRAIGKQLDEEILE